MLNKEEISECLVQAGLDPAARSKALKEIEAAEQAKKDDAAANKGQKLKNKLTVLIRTDDPIVKAALLNTAAFIVKTPESLDEDTIVNRITVSAARQNESIKRKGKIATFADWFRLIKGKHRKTEDTNVQNAVKEPVRIVVLDTEEVPFAAK